MRWLLRGLGSFKVGLLRLNNGLLWGIVADDVGLQCPSELQPGLLDQSSYELQSKLRYEGIK